LRVCFGVASGVVFVVILLFFILGWRRFLLDQHFAIEGTCGIELKPGLDALEIEFVIRVAREAHDKWEFICGSHQ
jgi:hypothetical protein